MKKIALLAAGSLALALSACGGPKTDEAPVETNVSNLDVVVDNGAFANDMAPTPSPEANVAATPAAPGADFADGAQTQDDADATGMTARVSRDDEGNETAPAR